LLKQPEIRDVARDLGAEARRRSYVRQILAPQFTEEPESWELIIELVEIVLHRRGLYIVHESMLNGTRESESPTT
jgi:hypothetical protein